MIIEKNEQEIIHHVRIVLTDNDTIYCNNITGTEVPKRDNQIHRLKMSELEYSKQDNAFCCPVHHLILIKSD